LSVTLDKSSVPKLAPGTDITKLPIGAREGFVLSRIDGRTSLGELASLCGFPYDEIERVIARLLEIRAAFFGDKPPWSIPPPAPPPDVSKDPTSSINIAVSKPAVVRSPRTLTRSRARKWGPADIDEPADLELELKGRILDLHGWLEDMDYYELLAVPREADRKQIKNAYYQLASTFHTDRYFGKQLGSFKSKMEAIFGRITLAHDTLANKTRRAEYDTYLVDRDRTRAFEAYLAGEESFEPEAEPEPPPAPAIVEPKPLTRPPPAAVIDDQKVRREALARRLMGASTSRIRVAPPAPPPVSAPPPPSADQSRAAAETLRRRYEDGREHARRTQSKRLIESADAALAKEDLLSAANHLRLALNYDDNPDTRAKYEDVNRRARDLMADTYLKQARYEEQSGKWGAAALSYAKAYEGRPDDPTICERAAHALRMEGRDLHKAARFAEIAVQKSPSSADFRVTLGAVYLDAGLFLRARTELEQAAKIDPNSATIKDLLARARKMAS
jgi:curved DNA-binding protein CbpA